MPMILTLPRRRLTIAENNLYHSYNKQPFIRMAVLFLCSMKISRILVAFILTLVLIQNNIANAQQGVRISLLTCEPGTELYSTFGHSAMRVFDSARGYDLVFNYGTFDFSDPDFYSKFVRGKLMYFLSVSTYSEFLWSYHQEQRSVTEQVLELQPAVKQEIYQALMRNQENANKYYAYDFLYDNCTTRLRDLLEQYVPNYISPKDILPEPMSFRDALHVYLKKNKQPWSQLGIDLLLGSKIDRAMDARTVQFLPDYLMKAVAGAKTENKKLEEASIQVLSFPPQTIETPWSPIWVNSIVVLVLFLATFFGGKLLTQWLDVIWWFLLGLIGVILSFMWLGTNHASCANNFNLIWALPTHIIAGTWIFKSKATAIRYFQLNLLLQLLLIASWYWLPQNMHEAWIPIILYSCWRSYVFIKKSSTHAKISQL